MAPVAHKGFFFQKNKHIAHKAFDEIKLAHQRL